MEEIVSTTSESGIFNSKIFQKIKRQGKPCIFSDKLSQNVTKYLFDFFYYRELYNLGSVNLFFYQCFRDYQLLTWKLEMNNIIDIFHLEIKNYDEEVDDTLTKCIKNKRTYNMKDHPGCFVRINKDGINIISSAYYDNSIKKENNINKNNTGMFLNKNLNLDFINDKLNKINMIESESPNKSYNTTENINLSEPPSNLGSADSIKPLKIATVFGILSSISSFVYFFILLIKTIIVGKDVPGYASILCVILLLGGIQLITIGILGEYLGRTYIEVKKRPIYLIKEKIGFDESLL